MCRLYTCEFVFANKNLDYADLQCVSLQGGNPFFLTAVKYKNTYLA